MRLRGATAVFAGSVALWLCAGCGSGYAARTFQSTTSFSTAGLAFGYYHAYGDSITAGATLADPSKQAYPVLTAQAKALPLENHAISGDQGCDVATRQIFPNGDSPALADKALYTLVIGTNDTNVKGTGAYEAVFNLCEQAAVAWLAVPAENKVLGKALATNSSGPLLLETSNNWNAVVLNTPATPISVPLTLQAAGTVYVWYRIRDGDTGAFTYALDGVAGGPVNGATAPAIRTQNGSTDSLALLRLPNVAAGSHTLRIARAGSVTGPVGIVGVGFTQPVTGQAAAGQSVAGQLPVVLVGLTPKTLDSSCAAFDVYRADIAANVNLLADDGLSVKLWDPGKYMLGTTADMSDRLHPNATGHQEIAKALIEALQ